MSPVPTTALRWALVLFVLFVAPALVGPRGHQDPEDPTAPWPRRGDYTGPQRCAECHQQRERELKRGHHGGLLDAGLDGCEICHGPGQGHADDEDTAPERITHPHKLGPAASIALCRSCHAEVDPKDFHWRDRHKPLLSVGMTCTTCHLIHADRTIAPPKPEELARATNRSCTSCHATAMCVLPGTVHEDLGRLDGPLATGCAICHDGALHHAISPGSKHLLESMHASPAAVQYAVCTRCHGAEDKLAHVRSGSHHRHEVGCLQCHSPAVERGRVRADAEKKCAACHADIQAQFALPHHHPVPEGRMGCTDCHEVHGARPRLRDHALTEGACVRCHPQYRGPFVFAHQAGRQEGCVTCHLPHGASNRRLLAETTAQQNCLQCHGDFPAFHDQTQGAVYTDCLRCHTQIHGSNHDRFYFR